MPRPSSPPFRDVDVLKGPDVAALPRARRACAATRGSGTASGSPSCIPTQGSPRAATTARACSKVEAGASSLLVTGDIERRGESAVLTQPIAADVVVVPHHGSATSSSPSFVAAVGAQHAIVSAGYANRWGFPRPEVRERWQQSGAAVSVTGDAGAVSVVLAPDGVAVAAERDGRHRYWHAPRFPW